MSLIVYKWRLYLLFHKKTRKMNSFSSIIIKTLVILVYWFRCFLNSWLFIELLYDFPTKIIETCSFEKKKSVKCFLEFLISLFFFFILMAIQMNISKTFHQSLLNPDYFWFLNKCDTAHIFFSFKFFIMQMSDWI